MVITALTGLTEAYLSVLARGSMAGAMATGAAAVIGAVEAGAAAVGAVEAMAVVEAMGAVEAMVVAGSTVVVVGFMVVVAGSTVVVAGFTAVVVGFMAAVVGFTAVVVGFTAVVAGFTAVVADSTVVVAATAADTAKSAIQPSRSKTAGNESCRPFLFLAPTFFRIAATGLFLCAESISVTRGCRAPLSIPVASRKNSMCMLIRSSLRGCSSSREGPRNDIVTRSACRKRGILENRIQK
jgi:hypothetical protein